ncbi:MAG TPA: 6-phosphogluconolactonase [Bryobacteraceae bacterium]|nr:6-phosphogluconolactonase [Bryobacteraceae bacterium]
MSGIRVVADSTALFQAGADAFVSAAKEAIEAKGHFNVALSGGSTPKGMFALLAEGSQVAWDKVRFFWGDERHVPPDHADSNYRMAKESLLAKIGAKAEQVWRIEAENPSAAEAAARYEQRLREYFGTAEGQFPAFDLILLGMGPDGHTASLFPGTKALNEMGGLVVSNWVGKFYTDRITFTAPLLNAAVSVVFLVGGGDKAPALKAVLEGPYEPAQLPAQMVRPERGRLVWVVDRAAGAMLKAG